MNPDDHKSYQSYETQIGSEIGSISEKKLSSSWKFEENLGFKRKIYDSYYTPKPETSSTQDITSNMEKLKRGYTPNLKIVSPSHKKPQEKPKIEDFII